MFCEIQGLERFQTARMTFS